MAEGTIHAVRRVSYWLSKNVIALVPSLKLNASGRLAFVSEYEVDGQTIAVAQLLSSRGPHAFSEAERKAVAAAVAPALGARVVTFVLEQQSDARGMYEIDCHPDGDEVFLLAASAAIAWMATLDWDWEWQSGVAREVICGARRGSLLPEFLGEERWAVR